MSANLIILCDSGTYGIVVAVDIADWDAEHRWMNGAAAVAMLIGPNAPLTVLPGRTSLL